LTARRNGSTPRTVRLLKYDDRTRAFRSGFGERHRRLWQIIRGSLETAAERGEQIPESVAVDSDGLPTADPETALDETILPFGRAKGSGLAVAVEVLAGGLVGAAMGRDVTGTYHTEDPCTEGDLFVAVDPEAVGGPGTVERIERFLDQLTDDGADSGVRLPGASSLGDERVETVSVDADLWERVRDLTD